MLDAARSRAATARDEPKLGRVDGLLAGRPSTDVLGRGKPEGRKSLSYEWLADPDYTRFESAHGRLHGQYPRHLKRLAEGQRH